jgi:hypothetical protein
MKADTGIGTYNFDALNGQQTESVGLTTLDWMDYTEPGKLNTLRICGNSRMDLWNLLAISA